MKYATVAWRAWALILDVVILMIIGYFVAADTGTATGVGYEFNGVSVVVTFVIWFAYYVMMETAFGGTIGKLLVGLHVVNTQGCRITLSQALIRNAMRIVDGLLFYVVGAVSAWSSPLHQRLGDRLAGTIVVRGAIEPSRLEVCYYARA
jgi:uncharacterized RDD family membrane protein YckC